MTQQEILDWQQTFWRLNCLSIGLGPGIIALLAGLPEVAFAVAVVCIEGGMLAGLLLRGAK